jgi:hypothetical protein
MTRFRVTALGVALLVGLAISSEAHASESPVNSPAVWFDYHMFVELRDLPQAYTCDELWYKFRDVLLAIGAAPNPGVVPLRCNTRSPEVEVRFSLPHVLQGAFRRYATIQAASSTVDLRPAYPTHLKASDCALVRQLTHTVFRDLPVRVLSADFSCRALRADSRPFNLTLETLKAVSQVQPPLALSDGPIKPAAAAPYPCASLHGRSCPL